MELRLPVDRRCAEKCKTGCLTCVAAAVRVNVWIVVRKEAKGSK